ncbi:purine-nucleoside phosphorylase [Undibacterium pigrum]|uniref:Purine nucleoside phosphorylase DeoD-type n=1 Tax=Undibacterium pigrum TaxID=401470 RepID=A0A318JMX3_9BURK|nr:purine-nucleoside phosphorylase [Undibacterium pigrum]PXX45341.1 purine-nucleoside phosphorylase [Undibacterium pigrum]
MTTPHINAAPGDFADIVLMPGDPLRAKMIADHWLSDALLVNTVRNMLGYTGWYRDQKISVLAHGMGIPSISIYATELICNYGVKKLIRLGSCGAVRGDMQLGDVLIAMGASTDSKVNRMRFMDHDFAAIADYPLLARAVETAAYLHKPVRVGNVFSSDLFYSVQPQLFDLMEKMQILAVEMELAGLYSVAAGHGVQALGLLTVADKLRTGASMTSEQRQNSFSDMVEIALESCCNQS